MVTPGALPCLLYRESKGRTFLTTFMEDAVAGPSTAAYYNSASAAFALASLKHVREYYEKHQVLLAVVTIVTVGSPFLGLVLAGWIGVAVGLLIDLTAFVVGFRAVTKVREIREGS
jgi:hypothetical protein